MSRSVEYVMHGIAWALAWLTTWVVILIVPLLFLSRGLAQLIARLDEQALVQLGIAYAIVTGVVAAILLVEYHRARRRGRGSLAEIKERSRGLLTSREVK